MAGHISIDFSEVGEMLKSMITSLEDIDAVLEESCGPILRASFEDQFARGGLPDPWKPLKPNTIAQKRYQGWPRRNRFGAIPGYTVQGGSFGPENILIRTGSLRVSWTRDDHPYHVCVARDGTLTIGSSLPYSVYHQSEEPRKRLPRRPLVVEDGVLEKCAIAFVIAVVIGPSQVGKSSRRKK